MAKALLELETLDADQLNDILAGKPPRPPKPASSQTPPSPPKDDAHGATAPATTV
jgi:cell division protease FtsH